MAIIISQRRPMGILTLTLTKEGDKVLIERSFSGLFSMNGSISIKGNFEKIVEGVHKWAEGELIQDVLQFLSVNEREFLITGMES